jgi:hypothetical protein
MLEKFILQVYYFIINVGQIYLICLIFEDVFRKKAFSSILVAISVPAMLLNLYGIFKNFIALDFNLSFQELSSNPFLSNFPPHLSFNLLGNAALILYWLIMIAEYGFSIRQWASRQYHKFRGD